MEIGAVLMKLRKEKKLTRIVVARAADIQENTLFMIEKGQTFPRQETLKSICAVLGVPVNYVLVLGVEDAKMNTPAMQPAFDALVKEMKKLLLDAPA